LESLKINGKIIDAQTLVSDGWDGLKESERRPLQIIRDWLSGQSEFSFQTSGSTGTPKLCSFSREQIIASAERTLDFFQLNQGNTVLCCLNTEFVAGFMMIIRALVGKLNLVVTDPAADLWKDLEYAIDFAAVTPMQIESGMRNYPEKISKIGTLLIGGAAIHPLLDKQLEALPGRVYHSYAMTETLTHVALREVVGPSRSDTYTALPGVTFSVNENACLVLHNALPGIGVLETNDVVTLVSDTAFRWIGRRDNIINSGGIKFQVERVEKDIANILTTRGFQSLFCLVAAPDTALTHKMIMLMESHENTMKQNEILNLLKAELPKYHYPREILFVQEILLTKTGKIDRKRNAEMYIHNRKLSV